MTRLNPGVIVLVAAALVLAVPSAVVFAQIVPTGGGGGGGERSTPPPTVSNSGGGGSAGTIAPSSGGSAPSGREFTGGNSGGGSGSSSGYSGGSPTFGDARRTANPREPRTDRVPMTQAAPWYSRPRGENPSTGTATVRTTPAGGGGPGGTDTGTYGPYYGYYGPYYGYYPGYSPFGYYANYGWAGLGGFGLYSYYYDPFWSGYGGYSGYGYGGYGYGSDYGGGYGWSTPSGYAQQQRPTGSIRLKVKPANATVYVDGYYSGRVDDFDGIFQKLRLEPGPHKIEISAQGFKSISFEVSIRIGETINFQGELELIR